MRGWLLAAVPAALMVLVSATAGTRMNRILEIAGQPLANSPLG